LLGILHLSTSHSQAALSEPKRASCLKDLHKVIEGGEMRGDYLLALYKNRRIAKTAEENRKRVRKEKSRSHQRLFAEKVSKDDFL